ncbi:MAG: hypothetical protein F6K22_22845 [Okeania sp. SIO2F4]|nr:hypothetical protein [Okeania sp. SIO2F4]NES05403.1 hypothetical protein [Okeania sp. SIO2F4]
MSDEISVTASSSNVFADLGINNIDLLQKVCTVSVETMKIIQAMKTADKS